nr:cold shock domain-containing protein [Fibrisoma montanum]
MSRQKGIIKWFNIEKGFGFITCDNGSDVYFNKEAIIYGDQLSAGELVEFDIRDSVKGPKAANIYVTST